MRSSTSIILALTAFTGLSQATVLPSYPLLNNGDAYWINQLKTIPVANHIISKRPWGTAPEHCVLTSNDNNFCSPYNLEIFDIYYADCHAPWVVCRCTDVPAAYSIDAIATNIGRIPVRARSWVRHYSFYPANNGGAAAYSTYSDINVFGEWVDSTILFHETGHNLDFWVAGNGVNEYSNSAEWQNLAAQDTCTPTDYSKASWQEHFAEVSVDAVYEENFGGIPVSTACMTNTLTKSRSILRSAIKIVSGDLCVDRLTPSSNVCMGPDARAQGACNSVPDTTKATTSAAKLTTDQNTTHVRLAADQSEFDAKIAKRYPGAFER